jgi:hypothetical protein
MMVVLNACHGAEGSSGSASGGIAQTLVRQGVPGVVAMQYEISDKAAKIFAEEYYRAFASGASVESAVVEARKAIYADGNDVEWGTPVLYLRATKAELLEGAKMSDEQQSKPQSGGISISVGGNNSGKINASQGDIYDIGSITNSTGVAIGPNAQSHVTQSTQNTINVFDAAAQTLKGLAIPIVEKEDAQETLDKLKGQDKPEPEKDKVDYYLGKLEKIAPPVVETLITALVSPGAAVGTGLKLAIQAWREARQGA